MSTNPHYFKFKDCWMKETIFGTSAIEQTTNAHLFGVTSRKIAWPAPKANIVTEGAAVGTQEPTAQWKSPFDLMGNLVIGVQNATPLWMQLGKSVTTGPVSEIYTHTITPLSVVSGPLGTNPSFTIHHEALGTDVTTEVFQYVGVKIFHLLLTMGRFPGETSVPWLYAKADWVARQALRPAFTLDNDPDLPATANTDLYKWNNMTVTWDKGGGGETVLAGLAEIKIGFTFEITPEKAHWWDGATYMGHYPYTLEEGPLKQYQVELNYMPEDYDLYDELLTTTGTPKDMEIKFERVASDDDIVISFGECSVAQHDVSTIPPQTTLEEPVVFAPKTCSIVVHDKLAGSVYGE